MQEENDYKHLYDISDLLMDEGGAVEARAGGYIEFDVEHDADVSCFHPINIHCNGGEVIFHVFAAVDYYVVQLTEPFYQTDRKHHLTLVDLIDSAL